MIAAAMAPATARLGRTAQIHRTIEVLGIFAPSSVERLKLLMGRVTKLRQHYAILDAEWTTVRQGLSGWSDSNAGTGASSGSKEQQQQKRKLTAQQQQNQDALLDLLERTRIQIEAAKAVVSKAEDSVAREVLHIAASPLHAHDNENATNWVSGSIRKRKQHGAGNMPMLIDVVMQLKRRLLLENATNELLDEKALLLANLLEEEKMRLLRTSELAQQELVGLHDTVAKYKDAGNEGNPTTARRLAVLEQHMVESAEVAAALDTGLASARRTSQEAQDALGALAVKNEKECIESGATALQGGRGVSRGGSFRAKQVDQVQQSQTYVLSKIVQGSQRLRLQEGRLTDRFMQAGVIDLSRLGSLPAAIRAGGCEDVERLVRVLYTCQLKVAWMTAARSDLKFGLLVEDYTVRVMKKVMLLEHVAAVDGEAHSAARLADVKARFLNAMARRAALATADRQLELELSQLQTQHSAMMLKVQRSPEPGSGLGGALVEARMRLNTLLLERAYSQMALCTAHALVVRLHATLAAKPLLDRASTRKGITVKGKDKAAIATAVSDAKEAVAEDPTVTIATHMVELQATVLSTSAAGVVSHDNNPTAAQSPAAREVAALRRSFRTSKRGNFAGLDDPTLFRFVQVLWPDQVVDPGSILFEPHACMGNLLHQPADGQPSRMLWCVLDTTRKVFEGYDQVQQGSPVLRIETENIISALHLPSHSTAMSSSYSNGLLSSSSAAAAAVASPEIERQFLVVSSDQTCHLVAPTTSDMQLWIACVGAISILEPKLIHSEEDSLGVLESDRLSTVLAKKLACGQITLSEFNHIKGFC